MQNKITKPSSLLDKKGELIQKGYATSPILKYNRIDVARKLRLKEWDYYLINNEDTAVALTVGKSNSILLISASVIDFKNQKETTKSLVRIVSKKKMKLPESSCVGDITYHDQEVNVSFLNIHGTRSLTLFMKNFEYGLDLNISLHLTNVPEDSMVIATPFMESKKDFYYNRKIIGMRASGNIRFNNQTYYFLPEYTFGILDWGRGVWPYKTAWYWSAGQGMIDDVNLFGFNLGYGFGETSAATENMIFYNGKASKLTDVTFHIPVNEDNEYDYMKPWTFTSSDHRFEMVFTPILDRSANLSLILLSTNQHQVFGRFTGTAELDDGTIIYLNDFLGFIERIENRW